MDLAVRSVAPAITWLLVRTTLGSITMPVPAPIALWNPSLASMSTISGPTCAAAVAASRGAGVVSGDACAGAVARARPVAANRLSKRRDPRGMPRCDPLIPITSCLNTSRFSQKCRDILILTTQLRSFNRSLRRSIRHIDAGFPDPAGRRSAGILPSGSFIASAERQLMSKGVFRMGVLDSFRLDDKVVIVTGASSGLGVSFAQAFAEAGADVVLGARRVDRLAETASLV